MSSVLDVTANRRRRRAMALLVSVVACVAAVLLAEAICRAVDRFSLTSLALRRVAPNSATTGDSRDRGYAERVARASSVKFAWYDERPAPIARLPLPPELQKRAHEYPGEPWSAFFEWNLAYLRQEACRPAPDVLIGGLRDFFFFESVDGSVYPTYRHLRRISPPNWFVTNAFGWRGPDVALERPANAIRIAFVGASTTVDAFGVPFSHPEMVGTWLNWWAAAKGLRLRFEVINAGRMGITSNSIAAIVAQELVPVDPDLVVYYEGANQFWPNQMVSVDGTRVDGPPKMTDVKRTAAEDYSALVRRGLTFADRIEGIGGYEPRKPTSRIKWPDAVNEYSPDVDSALLPMDLPNIVACLDRIRQALAPIHAELVLSSFVWVVDPGMRLDLSRDLTLFNYLNRVYWPFTYAELRRIADFQNRVFERYARTRNVPFIDLAADFPRDPALAGDAIHLRYEGLALQAWIYLQRLIPIIEQRLADGRLPRQPQPRRDVHPAFAQPSLRMITLDELRAQCH
jgi:hypothetical protein